MGPRRQVIVSADDFGLSEGVNEAVERACRDGLLTTTSLMVAGPAAADAVRRARSLAGLRVGLHLVVVEGPATGPAPGLLDAQGHFPSRQLGLSLDYFFRPGARRALAAEIRAQFRAFAATGLRLDHANAHKHMHLHPTVGRLMLEAGVEHGLPAIRVPAEPPAVMLACGAVPILGDRLLYAGTRVLRTQARRAGVRTNDYAFGIAWSGHMTAERVTRLARNLPLGLSEIYFHPASHRNAQLTRLMPNYEHEAELAALLDPTLRTAFGRAGAELTTYDAAWETAGWN